MTERLLAVVLAVVLAGCSKKDPAPGPGSGAPPPANPITRPGPIAEEHPSVAVPDANPERAAGSDTVIAGSDGSATEPRDERTADKSEEGLTRLIGDLLRVGGQETSTIALVAGHVLGLIEAWHQAEPLRDHAQLCTIAINIYREMLKMIRGGCDDMTGFCITLIQGLYGNAQPPFAMHTCLSKAEDQCKKIGNREAAVRALQKVIADLTARQRSGCK